MKVLLFIFISITLLFLIVSCNTYKEEKYCETKLISFSVDGSDQHIFQRALITFCNGNMNLIAMNDNKRFILSCNDLHIANTETGTFETFLEDIPIDNGEEWPTGIESIGLSNNDNYLAFTSEKDLYCFNMTINEYEKITASGKDSAPKFGIDDKIYFIREDEMNDMFKVMNIATNGTELSEVCNVQDKITHIFPGKVDSNILYFVTYVSKFYIVHIPDVEVTELCEFPDNMRIISRSGNDRYFFFNNSNGPRYLFDTVLNELQIIDYPYLSKLFPNDKKLISKNIDGKANIRIWDLDSQQQIGNTIILSNTVEDGLPFIVTSPDGLNCATIHKAY